MARTDRAMKVLLDTHAMLWWLTDDPRLSATARQTLADRSSTLLWSLASSWEIAIKISLGKLHLNRPVQQLFADIVSVQAVEALDTTHAHCRQLAHLPLLHRDPFDRMLVAQAQVERLPLLSADPKIAAYEVTVIW